MSEKAKRYVNLGGMVPVDWGVGSGVYVTAADYDALTQRCRELQEDRQRTADELVAFVHGEHSAVCAERDTLRGLLAECAEYLNTNNLTRIGHGSILHRKMIDAAMEAPR